MNKLRKLFLFLLISVFYMTGNVFSQEEASAKWSYVDGTYMPLPPANQHPRLYLRSEHIPSLSERKKDPILGKVWNDLQKLKKDKEIDQSEQLNWRHYFDAQGLFTRAELTALDYLITRDSQTGRQAIEMIIDTLETAKYPQMSDISRAIGRLMISGAMVYDWCYDELAENEKDRFVKAFVRLAGMLECGYPPTKDNSIVGHASEWMIMRDLISTGIAIYDEYPEMYNLAAGRFFKEHLPVRNWFYSGQAHHQGMSYMNVRFTNELFALWIFDRMGAGNIFNPAQQYVLYDMIYKRRPDGQIMPSGDMNYTRKREHTYPLPTMLASSYYKDEYIYHEYLKRTQIDSHSKIFEFLWRDTSLKNRSPEDLPLTKFSGTPFGWMIARTGWGKNSVIAEMKINEYNFANHQHHDAGSFQIYYKGPLAIDAGIYQGATTGYNSPHNKNYFKRTIAHNSLLIYDPDERFPSIRYGGADKSEYVDNDGGQRLPDNWGPAKDISELMYKGYRTGQILAKSCGQDIEEPEYSYLKGDITSAYSDKVKEVKRSFVFLNLKDQKIPAALIVYDKIISTNPDFKKFWLLHSIEEPYISDNNIAIKRTKNGDSGMLYNTVLLPEANNAEINPVGGPGKEFWVFGTNYYTDVRNNADEANERGAWRVEVSPKTPSLEDKYLNVIQVADNDNKEFHLAEKIESDDVLGVIISNRIVTFSKESNLLRKSFDFNIDKKGDYKILITDVEPGVWQVISNGRVINDNIRVGFQESTIYVEAQEGQIKVVKK